MTEFTLILPYYCQPEMLRRQDREWRLYPDWIRVIVVDDGSPDHAADEVLPGDSRASVYRIEPDIPWNRNGARNLGAHVCGTDWMLHTDIDHVLPLSSVDSLAGQLPFLRADQWYRFERLRIGAADRHRQKDALPEACRKGEVKPHVDSFLCTQERYWRAGGYDEDFRGSLGGSSLFLKHMRDEAGAAQVLPVRLHVHTSDSVADASECRLSRDRSRYERIRAEKRKQGDPKAVDHLRFDWRRVR